MEKKKGEAKEEEKKETERSGKGRTLSNVQFPVVASWDPYTATTATTTRTKHRTLHHKSLHAERSWLCPQSFHSILSVIHFIPGWLYHFTVPQQHVSDPTSPELLQHWKPVLSFMLESPVGVCMVLHWGLNFHLRMPGGACHLLAFISLTFLCVFCSYANWIICFRLTWI